MDTPAQRQCPFCRITAERVVLQNDAAIALRDLYPLSRGHTLVIPRRHEESVFDMSPKELRRLWELVKETREHLQHELAPDAFTIGVNDGTAAGKTVAHGHVHVIPRWHGDIPDPRGGIRWVIPERAAYWNNPG